MQFRNKINLKTKKRRVVKENCFQRRNHMVRDYGSAFMKIALELKTRNNSKVFRTHTLHGLSDRIVFMLSYNEGGTTTNSSLGLLDLGTFYDLTRFALQIDGRSNAAGCPFCRQLTRFVGQKGNELQP